ncbi:hypothetical protein [Azohydromonas lata]|uniref:Uncharacterized protein n=1 Tax=Azohydromonas lata TaxID=45677 RepID=A0ABU5IER1_9BURK|nr:hypothetical protein [Azohydromonas lata]MDZ5457026.1 hypothetical protein [Azohydromonas lata]
MSRHASVIHINLLQPRAATFGVGKSLAALLALALAGVAYHGSDVSSASSRARRERDDLTQQLSQAKARLAALRGEQAQNAGVLQLRQEVESLRPQAQAAQALTDAMHAAEGGRADAFLQALGALASVKEPGLWLTALNVGEGGRRLEVQGVAGSGAAVLRFARRANELLQPLGARLDGLEMQPLPQGGGQGGQGGAVSFRLR